MSPSNPEELIQEEVASALTLNQELTQLETQLSASPEFQRFLELQKTVPAKLQATWDMVEAQMIEHNIKSIKGEWGSLTIAERLDFDIDHEQLQPKFYKKVPDTKKIRDTFRLEGKAPKGTTPKYGKHLTKRLK